MYETDDDIRQLQDLIDRSHTNGGAYLRKVFSDERRVPADELPGLLTGLQVTALATVTARGEPRVAPVDGLFFRGRLWFGSAHESARFRHIRARPQVSASIMHGNGFAVVIHGRAHEVDTADPAVEPFVAYCREIYGEKWDRLLRGMPYARIDAERMYTYRRSTD